MRESQGSTNRGTIMSGLAIVGGLALFAGGVTAAATISGIAGLVTAMTIGGSGIALVATGITSTVMRRRLNQINLEPQMDHTLPIQSGVVDAQQQTAISFARTQTTLGRVDAEDQVDNPFFVQSGDDYARREAAIISFPEPPKTETSRTITNPIVPPPPSAPPEYIVGEQNRLVIKPLRVPAAIQAGVPSAPPQTPRPTTPRSAIAPEQGNAILPDDTNRNL